MEIERNSNKLSTTLFGLVLMAILYTAWGLVAASLWASVAPALSLPVFTKVTVVKVWWLWLLVWLPPVLTISMMIVGVFEPYLKKILTRD